jgi:hypothetical protein
VDFRIVQLTLLPALQERSCRGFGPFASILDSPWPIHLLLAASGKRGASCDHLLRAYGKQPESRVDQNRGPSSADPAPRFQNSSLPIYVHEEEVCDIKRLFLNQGEPLTKALHFLHNQLMNRASNVTSE